MVKSLEFAAMLFGVIGACIVAFKPPKISIRTGFWFYQISNTFLILFCLKTEAYWLLTQSLIFVGINAVGLLRWKEN